MHKNRPGFLTLNALIAALVTLAVIGGVSLVSGSQMFSPGNLNARAGTLIGGVSSHAEIGIACAQCHTAPWSQERMAHRCIACHTKIEQDLSDPDLLHGALYRMDPIMACQDCHPEHRGADSDLTQIKNFSNFPHAPLGFSLRGHRNLDASNAFECQDCHTTGFSQFDQAICQDCHVEKDAVFALSHALSFGLDCLNCHDGIDTYGKAFSHNLTSFILTGKHLQLECTQCHLNARALEDLRATPTACADCHLPDEPHAGKFGRFCDECHTVDGWTPAVFDHSLARFPLVGKHINVECTDCHRSGLLEPMASECSACHLKDDTHKGSLGQDCAVCHSPEGWKPSTFNHARSAFQLTGKHVSVQCQDCHLSGVFKGTDSSCGACHSRQDPHQGRFGTDCSACHTTSGWKPATFDHNLSAFRLTGAHASTPCTACHTNNRYKGTPTTCSACHREPQAHAGMFSLNCANCHNTSAWLPATYNGPHSFPMNHGKATSCSDCHTGSLLTWTCFSCHDRAKMEEKHNEKGIPNFSNCLQCHPTGREKPED